MNEWIRCEDRLPDMVDGQTYSKPYLICAWVHGCVPWLDIACYCLGEEKTYWASSSAQVAHDPKYITHWMPLPELPEKE